MKHRVQKHGFAHWDCRQARRGRGFRTLACVALPLACSIFFVPRACAGPGELTFVEAEFDGVGGVDGLWEALEVAVSPDGQHVYVASQFDDAVAVFSRNGTTGELTFVEAEFDGVGGVAGLDAAIGVAVSPDGQHVYVTGGSDDAVAVFSRDGTTGELTFVEAEFDGVGGVDGLHWASEVTVSPDGQHVYVTGWTDNAVAVFSRSATTGELTFVEAEFDGVGGVDGLYQATDATVSPDGRHVYVTGGGDSAVAVFSRNGTTGELTFVEAEFDDVGGVDGLYSASGVTVSPYGRHVYVTGAWDDSVAVFSRNGTTGELTFVEAEFDGVGGVDGLDYAYGVAVSSDGQHVYVTGATDNAVAVFSRRLTTGGLTFVKAEFDGVGWVDGLDGAVGIAVSPDDQHVYVAGGGDDAVAVFSREVPVVPTVTLVGLAILSVTVLALGARRRTVC